MESIFSKLQTVTENYYSGLSDLSIVPKRTVSEIRNYLENRNLEHGENIENTLEDILPWMQEGNIHVPHPGYFGLFNPATSFSAVVGDYLTALFNPQMAAYSHAHFSNEVEKLLIQFYVEKMKWPSHATGHFTSGGSDANFTGVLCALAHHFPEYLTEGLIGLKAKPRFYVSMLAHNSFDKIAKNAGLGTSAVYKIPLKDDFSLDISALKNQIKLDKDLGYHPFLIVGTAGSTPIGSIDPLPALAEIAKKEEMWLHVDAAWAGGAIISSVIAGQLEGIELADSVTADAHKWLSVPMGAGMFFCKYPDTVYKTFKTEALYMPSQNNQDPYQNSLLWSRRFIGLKVYMAFRVKGALKMAEEIEKQLYLADYLADGLIKRGWKLPVKSALGVIVFTHDKLANMSSAELAAFHKRIIENGNTWFSILKLKEKEYFRACITSIHTEEQHINQLFINLEEALRKLPF
ncbi:MAG: aminotransferase class I/II-fold pyridoxal phosphate-dependent enzyme [Bacteroidetes bacterium]|nr:aminotransferase class I/II-fold pyridoxal phosphate-dependent enzyme [Bacteroidota bacterium]